MNEPLITLGTLFTYIDKYYPETKYWDNISKHEKRLPSKSYKHRQGLPNEIRIEFDSDDKDRNWENINLTGVNLWKAGYSFAMFYVKGGRSPHIHLYDIDELDNWPLEKRNYYRRMFLNKFCPTGSEPDFGLCDEKHLCALEFAPHFKHKNTKKLLHLFWQGKNQGMDNNILWEMLYGLPKEKKERLIKKKRSTLTGSIRDKSRQLIIDNLNFEQVWDKYKVDYKHTMALCPFHADKDRSLSFTNSNGLWKCWGCEEKGDIISLIQKLKERDDGRN